MTATARTPGDADIDQAGQADSTNTDVLTLEDIYRTFAPVVRWYLRRFVPAADIDDVVQRVFFEVWRSWDRYDPTRSQRAWVLGIARKRAIDHLRRHTAALSLELDPTLVGDDGRDTQQRHAWTDTVRTALNVLPVNQRTVLDLAYFAGYTQAEIADYLAVPLGTVKSRTARGLRSLTDLLAAEV